MSRTVTPAEQSLPWSREAEQAVLGGLMLDPDAPLRLVETPLQAGHFFDHAHGVIFTIIGAMTARHAPVDVLTVYEQLQAVGKADDCGGMAYLNDMSASTPSAASIAHYAKIVRQHAVRRGIIEAADRARTIAMEAGDADEIVDRAAALFTSIERTQVHREAASVADLIAQRLQRWEQLQAGDVLPGMPTHLPTIDRALGGGLKRGKVVVIGARPSVGKTSLATQIVLNLGADGHSVLMLSQEMQAGELIDRAVANLGRVRLEALTAGRFEGDDWSRIADATQAAAGMPIYIDDQPALTLLDIRAKARRRQQRGGLALLVIDYLQLCSPGAGRQDHRHHQIEAISRGLKQLAKELDIGVMVLSQINRASTHRPDSEPTLADLKESGAIEEDADTVLLLHPKGNLPDGSMLVAAILAKNRQGRRGRVALAFDGRTQRWVESTASVAPRGADQ